MSNICDDLRAAILQTAMQGKLTDQLPEDGDAKELIEQIYFKKEEQIKNGFIKRPTLTKEIQDCDIPFDIPENWVWARVGELGIMECGFSFKSTDYKEKGVQVVRISDLGEDEILTKNAVYCSEDASLTKYEIKTNSILICLTGSIGKMALITDDKKRYLNQRVGMYSLYENSVLDYMWRILHAENIKFDWISRKTSTNGNIKNDVVLDTLIPLPPLAEQKRIVKKIDKLMARVVDLEQSADALASLKKSFPDDIKASLLQYAMQGKLTEQLPGDGDAEKLLEQIKVEKEKLITEGKIKKQKAPAPITDDEIPFSIPENWRWARVGDIFDHNTGKTKNSAQNNGGNPRKYITTSNMYWNYFDFSKVGVMNFNDNELEKYTVKKGDILVCEGGDFGRTAIWEYDEEVCFQNHIHRLRFFKKLDHKYFYWLFYLYKNIGLIKGKGIGIQGLSSGALHNIVFPLPPLAEQKRIVERLEELMQNINAVGELIASE